MKMPMGGSSPPATWIAAVTGIQECQLTAIGRGCHGPVVASSSLRGSDRVPRSTGNYLWGSLSAADEWSIGSHELQRSAE